MDSDFAMLVSELYRILGREEPIMHIKVQIFIFFEKICFHDAVDCPEWIVPYHVFKVLAEEYELDLAPVKNSHEFVHEYLKRPEYVEMMRRLGALGDGNQDQSTLSPDEWEVAYLYLSFVLRKRGQPDRSQVNGGRDKGKMRLEKEDILYINNDL